MAEPDPGAVAELLMLLVDRVEALEKLEICIAEFE